VAAAEDRGMVSWPEGVDSWPKGFFMARGGGFIARGDKLWPEGVYYLIIFEAFDLHMFVPGQKVVSQVMPTEPLSNLQGGNSIPSSVKGQCPLLFMACVTDYYNVRNLISSGTQPMFDVF
jgi:hypothetical protein